MNFTLKELNDWLAQYTDLNVEIDFISSPIDAGSFNDFLCAGTIRGTKRDRKVLIVTAAKESNSWYMHKFLRKVYECKLIHEDVAPGTIILS